MQIQNQNLILEGFDRIQEVLMRLRLSNIVLPNEPVKIELHQKIEYGKCSGMWYGGILASVTSGENEFSLYAKGHVHAYLVDKRNNETVAHVKDKSGEGRFMDEMSRYIKNDTHLMAIRLEKDPIYSLDLIDGNWFEVFFDKLNGDKLIESYICLNDNIFAAIAEIVKNIESWADGYKR